MPTQGIRVLVLGRTLDLPKDYEIRNLERTSELKILLSQFEPDVIITSLDKPYGELTNAGYQVRSRWIAPPADASVEAVCKAIENVYYNNIFFRLQYQDDWPLVSVYTGTYNTGQYLMEAYISLFEQTYKNWEWVVVDDQSTDGTWERLEQLAKDDYRVRPFRSGRPIHRIGGVKGTATKLCQGDIYVELDHDDMLTDFALDEIRLAFQKNPEVGMVYSNCANFFENGGFHRFDGPDWKDQYRETEYRGKKWLECINHNVYDRFGPEYWQQFGYFLTVGPNHVRAYRASEFKRLGGYNHGMPVADDFELYARFFLRSRCYHINKMLYLYRFRDGWENTTFTKNKSIQDHLQLARNRLYQEFDAFNKERLKKESGNKDDRVAFVIASAKEGDAHSIKPCLKDQDVFEVVGAPSILDAYETGRLHWAGRRRIVYIHNDTKLLNPLGFIKIVQGLPPGLHGVGGTADPTAMDKDCWWDCADCHGKARQQQNWDVVNDAVAGKPEVAHEVVWMDGVCLVAIDQTWSWKVPGNPKLWHGYDWLACKRTRENGGKCYTIAQPEEPLLFHKGNSRMGGFPEAMKVIRVLAKPATERRDYSNIKDHLPRLEATAHGNVLELGCREGVSTSALLAGVEKNGGFVWSVDIDPEYSGVWEGHPQWKFILSDAADAAKITAAGVPSELDLIFVDTGSGEKSDVHTFEQTEKELAQWGLRTNPNGGKIILHDTETFPGVKKAALAFAGKCGFGIQLFTECNGLCVLSRPPGIACSPGIQGTQGVPGIPSTPTKSPCPSGPRGEAGLPGIKSDLTTKDVSYIIPVANCSNLTLACLESIRMWSPLSEVIVAANGCEISSAVKALADKVVPIEMNARFGAGCNRAAMEATRHLICILNDDALFVDDAPFKLVQTLTREFSIVAPFSNRAKPPQGDVDRNLVPDRDIELPMVVGVCMMMYTDLYRMLGGFDTRLDTYEDDDICYRASSLYGVKSKAVGGTYVQHERHATFKALGEDVQKVMNDNGVVFRKKHPKIKVIVIAKNEERSVKDFFEQFRSITTDWNLLDTGSTDKTAEICQSIGVNVKKGVLLDYAQARNEALTQFAGDCDWIIMMDPDERLDFHTIRHLKETLFKTEYEIFLAPLWAVHPDGKEIEWVAKPFLFRNNPEIKWFFLVHEKVLGSTKQALVKNGRINHILALHEDGRRGQMSAFYQDLQNREPFYNDPNYQAAMRAKYAILDYDHRDDSRIDKIFVGPLISVIIPTYKRKDLLLKAVASVSSQDYVNKEIIIVGDNCPDLERMFNFSTVVRKYNLPKNHGAGGAVPRNYGIIFSAGKLISYLDDDCTHAPDHLSTLYEKLRNQDASYALGSFRMIEPDSSKYVDIICDRPRLYRVDTSAVLHEKDLVRKYGFWKDRTDASYSHDFEFVSRWKNEPCAISNKITMFYLNTAHQNLEFIKNV
jgi:glycosyltransferase involved in cell wall biosynthesis